MKKIKTAFLKSILIIVSVVVVGILGMFGMLMYFSFDLPKISNLSEYNPPLKSKVLSSDGEVLLDIGNEDREIVEMKDVPKVIVDAFLSAEDDNFYKHQGVDYLGIFRAMMANMMAGRVVQGGSTITQQVAKSLLLSQERSLGRKIKDFLLAQRIEKKFTKDEILFLYFNQVYLGGGYYGIKSAFRGYFGKELSEGTIAESALVAGLLVAPGRYSPYINPKVAKVRQRYVLSRMHVNKRITDEQYKAALEESIRMKIKQRAAFKAPYFSEWVKQRLFSAYGEDVVTKAGYKVVTTLDWELQQKAEKAIKVGVRETDKRQGYKGPLSHLETDADIEGFERDRRSALFKEHSQYFTLSPEGSIDYELSVEKNKIEELIQFRDGYRESELSRIFDVGNPEKDGLQTLLENGETYKAVVLKVSDEQQLIYVGLGGLRGLIPAEHYQWARARKLDENSYGPPLISKPSSILKRGDVILVRYLGNVKVPGSLVRGDFKKNIKDKTVLGKFNEQRFLLLGLDQEPEVQGSLLSINPFSGNIISFVGGNDFNASQYNRVLQAERQPGSAFKPIIYAAALENGFTPSSIVMDSPEALSGVDDSLSWKPKNYDGEFLGPITFRRSLEKSRNVPTIKIASKLGVDKIRNFSNRIGLNLKISQDLSFALGSFGVTLMDLTRTYVMFPNGGQKIATKSIVSITDRFGIGQDVEKAEYAVIQGANSIKVPTPAATVAPVPTMAAKAGADAIPADEKTGLSFFDTLNEKQVYDTRLSYIMTNLLKGVVHHGTATEALKLSPLLGGKTGTTSNYIDAWFVGFSANLVTGVWIGFDDNKTLGHGETGTRSALPIWIDYMDPAIKKFGTYDFNPPKGIITVRINAENGKLAEQNNPSATLEAFVEGSEPGGRFAEESQVQIKGSAPIVEDDEYFDQE